jgi:hypothetical protein
MQQAGSCRTQSRAEADLRQTPCGVTSADHRSRSHAIPMSEQCNASAWTCSDEAMRYNRCTSPATFSMVSCNNSCIADQHQRLYHVNPRMRTIPQQHHVRRLATVWLRRDRRPYVQQRFDLAPSQDSSTQHGVPRTYLSASWTVSRHFHQRPIACEALVD